MESMSHDPAAGAIGLQLVEMATAAVGSATAASMSVTGLVPAGADEVSALAAAAFAAEGAAVLTANTAAQEELARAGAALTDIARIYSEVDGQAAGTLVSAGSEFTAGQPFAGGSSAGAGLLRAGTLPGADGSSPRTPLLGNLIDGAGSNPSTTVPPTTAPSTGVPPTRVPATSMPAAVSAASMALGAGAAPLSSIGSIAQGAMAGGTAGPGLASSVGEEDKDQSQGAGSGEQRPGERLV